MEWRGEIVAWCRAVVLKVSYQRHQHHVGTYYLCRFSSFPQTYWIRNSRVGPSNLCFDKPSRWSDAQKSLRSTGVGIAGGDGEGRFRMCLNRNDRTCIRVLRKKEEWVMFEQLGRQGPYLVWWWRLAGMGKGRNFWVPWVWDVFEMSKWQCWAVAGSMSV